MTDTRATDTTSGSARRRAVPALFAVGAAVAWTLAAVPFANPAARALGLGLYALAAVVVLDRIAAYHPHGRFGIGNAVTLTRAGGTAVFAALAVEPGLLAGGAGWAALAGAAALLALDGIDGWAARRSGSVSAFGARFDMEVDAGLILALALIAAGLGKAGPWVVGLGLLRYVFVVAGRVWPRLARPLPPSRRRRAVCALQVAALGLMLAPPLVPPASALLAAAVLAALLWSFAADVVHLVRA